MSEPRGGAPSGDPPGSTASPDPEPANRRGLIGPFTARQLGVALLVVVVAFGGLIVVTRPIAPAPGTGAPTALPGATPFLVGEARPGLRPGDLAPELAWTGEDGGTVQLRDLDGNPVRLEDLRGKLVWLNFWATWCPPCQAETPILREMDEVYRDRGLVIVAVAVQETTVDDVKAYAERYELEFPIAFDASADIFDLYKVFALPTQFFIGGDGRVLEVLNGPVTDGAVRSRIEGWLPSEVASDPGPS